MDNDMKKKELIALFRGPSPKELSSLKDKLNSKTDETVILGMDPEAISILQDSGIPYVSIRDHFAREEYASLADELIEMVENFGAVKSGTGPGGRSLNEFLQSGDIVLWDLLKMHFCEEVFEQYFLYKIFTRVINTVRPARVIIFSRNNLAEDILRSAANINSLEVTICPPGFVAGTRSAFRSAFNYLVNVPYPVINILKKTPDIFILLDWAKDLKERFILKFQTPAVRDGKPHARDRIVAISYSTPFHFIRSVSNLSKEKAGYPITLIRADELTKDFRSICSIKNLYYATHYEYFDREKHREGVKLSRDLYDRVKKIGPHLLAGRFMKITGLPVKFHIEKFVRSHLSRYGIRRLVRFKLTVGSILDRERPGAVLLRDDTTKFGKLAARIATKRNIRLMIASPLRAAYDPVWNGFLRRSMEKMPGDTVLIADTYIADSLSGKKFMEKDEICKRSGIDKSKRILLFTSQALPPVPDSDMIHRLLIRAMENFPEYHLMIKLHPSESRFRSLWAARRAKLRNVSVVKNFDFLDLVKSSALLITFNTSITGLQAMCLGKPVVILDLWPYLGKHESMPYLESGAAFAVHDRRELVPTIRRALYDDGAREEIFRKAGKFVKDNEALCR